MGAICPTGNSAEAAWKGAAAGISGIDRITLFDPVIIENHIAGEVKGFDPVEAIGRREVRRTDRATQFVMVAAREAIESSGFEVTDDNRYRIGCVIGSGVGGISSLVEATYEFEAKGHKGVSPLAVTRILADTSSAKVSLMYGLRGPNFCIVTACATGNNCLGEAAEVIRRGQADIMIAGATEAAIVPVTMASFNNMTALSRRNNDPQKASRPFDLDRDGFVTGEGAALLVLEELEHALARGATIYAEILGYGHTSDAYHVTAPIETGEGAAEAMLMAMADAGIGPQDIDYINAHGTGTPLNDKSETLAIKQALGEYAYEIPISSTKSVTGHMLGAGGAIEAVFSIMAMRDGFVPPTINLDTPDPDCDLDYTPHVGVKRSIRIVMSNSFGFGGHNAVIILGKYSSNGR